ncbi:odorant receptor Or2-like [Schistocerca americana]|uniref:odorant receptor Or2-like n=1 Tax=Schistocerca americana TaxID=7009 RepID=UPI001F501AD7|nr:odorant receptor Or2-like [Schistocerca americana]
MGWDSEESQPLTWQYTGGSVLKCDLRMLHLIGVWPLSGSRLYRCLVTVVIALCFGHFVEAVIHLCTLDGYLEDFTLALSNISVVIVGVLKVTFFLRHERSYCRLVRWLDGLVTSQREYTRGRPQLEEVSAGAQRLARRITKAFTVYDALVVLAWTLVPLTAPAEAKRLPFEQLPLTEESPYSIYALSYAIQGASTFWIAVISVQMDCFFTAVMIHAASQLSILSLRISDLQLGNGHLQLEFNGSLDGMYEELRLCIHTHQDIARFVKHLESVMNPIAMMQLAVGVFNGCMLIFPATYSSENEALLKCVAAAPTISAQLLLYCLGAHSVREQGEAVSLGAYSCGWQDASAGFRRALLVVMARAQKPLTLTAGGIYPIQRATFLSLLNAGYSYYAVLRNFNSH